MNLKSRPPSNDGGFTLVELAVSLAVLGIAFSGSLLAASHYIRAEKVKETREQIALVQNVLSAYAQTHYRLPCPADPQAANGTEVDNGNCFTNATNASLYWETEGVLPWKELGIPQTMAMDAWQHYITYKPAPHLTVDNLSDQMQDTANSDQNNDTHNACRTAMWYGVDGHHLNRAKALFCCNAAPKNAYIPAKGLSPLSADWRQNGIVDTTTAQTTATGGTSLPTATLVAMTTNWMDSHTLGAVHGTFSQGFNGTKPEPPLMRATGLAVTLISHGGNGDLAFLPQQVKTALFGGGRVTVGTGVTAPGDAAVEIYNVWPPHVFSGVFGHPKVSDGSYNSLDASQTASDDIVSYVRSDDLFGLVGQASCERPPGAVFQPEPPCTPQIMSMQPNEFDPVNGAKVTMNSISMHLQQDQGIPYILRAVAQRLSDDAGYNNSLGVYTISKDGSVKSVALVTQNMHSLAIGQSATTTTPIPEDGSSIGTFLLANGYNVNNNYKDLDMTSLQMVYNYGQSDQRNANVADTDTSKISLIAKNAKTGNIVQLHGANNDGSGAYNPGNSADNGVHNMYSAMNYGKIDYGWRPDDINSKTLLQNAGVDPTDDTKMEVGFEDLSNISCYYTVAAPGQPDTCNSKKPPLPADPDNVKQGEARMDQYGGYMASIGDNDYDDIATSMSMTACPVQN